MGWSGGGGMPRERRSATGSETGKDGRPVRSLRRLALSDSVGFWLGAAACSGVVLYLPAYASEVEIAVAEGPRASAEIDDVRV